MKLQDYMIGLLIIGACVLAVNGFIVKLASAPYYNIDLQGGDYNYTTYAKVDEVFEDWNQTKTGLEQILGSDEDTEYEDYRVGLWGKIKNTLFGTGKAIKGATAGTVGGLTLGFSLIKDLGRGVALPSWVTSLLMAALTIMICIILYQFLSGRKP